MDIYKPTPEELQETLRLHKMWLNNEDGGKRANMSCWSLRSADLRLANLSSADLRSADLRSADLSSANLRSADLRLAENLFYPIACPSHGAFTAWKKACYCSDKIATPDKTKPVIVELLIPADAKRSSATTRKCRCDKAQVVSITDLYGNSYAEAFSQRDCRFVYKVGEIVSVPDFDENRWNECSTGIHFFIDRGEAERW